jgi:hypothetical protein
MSLTRSPFLQTRVQGGSGDLVIVNAGFAPSNVFFVQSTHSNAGDSSGKGQTPDAPFATIDFAIGQCSANQGDLILVLPCHQESVTAAGGLDLDVAGITIQGIGDGRARPTITLSGATAADIDVDAAKITLRNVVIDMTGIDAVAAGLDVNAADFTLENCQVILATASAQAVLGIVGDANADRLTIRRCRFIGTADAGTTCAVSLTGEEDTLIEECLFIGAYSSAVGAIRSVTTANVRCVLRGCLISNLTAACTKAITMLTGSTGQISGCHLQILSGTSPITGDAMSWIGANYYAAALGTGSILI